MGVVEKTMKRMWKGKGKGERWKDGRCGGGPRNVKNRKKNRVRGVSLINVLGHFGFGSNA